MIRVPLQGVRRQNSSLE